MKVNLATAFQPTKQRRSTKFCVKYRVLSNHSQKFSRQNSVPLFCVRTRKRVYAVTWWNVLLFCVSTYERKRLSLTSWRSSQKDDSIIVRLNSSSKDACLVGNTPRSATEGPVVCRLPLLPPEKPRSEPIPLSVSTLLKKNATSVVASAQSVGPVTSKLRLHTAINRADLISYLGACYIRTKVTKCNHEKMTLYFRGWSIKSHSPGYEIGLINRSV